MISTSAPIAIAPALRQRSTFMLASTIASSEPPRTKVSIVHIGRDDADRIAALGDDRVDADRVVVVEGFALAVDGVERELRRGQGVDAELRRAAGVAGAAEKADLLDQRAVRRFGDEGALGHLVVRADVDHHRHVDVVEMALGDELGLAEQELDLALCRAPRRSSTSMNSSAGTAKNTSSPREVLGRARRRQTHRDAEHAGDLGVVAAAMGGAGMRVGERVVGGAQAVEFAEEREARARASCRARRPLTPVSGEAGLRLEAQIAHRSATSGGGLLAR